MSGLSLYDYRATTEIQRQGHPFYSLITEPWNNGVLFAPQQPPTTTSHSFKFDVSEMRCVTCRREFSPDETPLIIIRPGTGLKPGAIEDRAVLYTIGAYCSEHEEDAQA